MPIDPSSDDDNARWNNPGPLRLTIHPQAPPRPPSNAPLIPGASYDDWAARNDPLGGTSYPDDWYVPANAGTGASYPDDWIYPSDWIVPPPSTATSTSPPPSNVPSRPPAPPDPFAAYWSSIPASRVGALAWHPPIFPDALGQFSIPAPAPLTAPPEAANGILGGIAKMLAARTDGPSLLGAIGRLPSPASAPTNIPGGLFSGDPSIRTDGLFPYSFGSAPGLASPFQRGFLPASGHARPMPGTPGAPATLGLPASNSPLLPPAQSQTSPAASSSSFDPLNGPPANSPVGMPVPAAPTRSVLFTHPPAPWDPAALDRALANLDQPDPSLAASGLPISKSGAPFIPPPLPQFSITPEQAFDVAHPLSPNIADYLTKPLPPLQPFPATPGKIASTENPYAAGAALEAATWFLPADRIATAVAGTVERGAAEAASMATKAAAAQVPPLAIPERLQAHVKNAVVRVEAEGLTDGQKRAIAGHPRLAAAYKGERIDTFAKETIAEDENLRHLVITPRFRFGPDLFDPINNVWYDIATRGGWARHEKKYGSRFGRGIPLLYGDK